MIAKRLALLFLVPCLLAAGSLAAAQTTPHLFFRVTLGSGMAPVASGRVLIFLEAGSGAKQVQANEFHPSATSIAAEEVTDLHPGESIDVDVDRIAFPAPFSALKPGTYQAQAVLDVGHTYAYNGLDPGDLESGVVALPSWTPGSGSEPTFVLDKVVPERKMPNLKMSAEVLAAAKASMHLADFVSPALTAFWGRPMHMRAWVVLPPGYADHGREHYPTVYWTHGFGATLPYDRLFGMMMYERMAEKKMPPMIWVMLDESFPTGTHEFDNSVNNGPWGTALTAEFIPWIQTQYRMDAKASGRFLQGHSSGGWATLQLQIDYPRVFGGTWSTSPDPSDFHNFTGPDLYAPHANVYYEPDGTLYPLVRDKGKVVATFKEFAEQETVLGGYGGQIASFEWVFSPRGPDGQPEEMFDRKTGDVHPAVVAYWREHYDLAHLAKTEWPEQGRYLKGKIHLIVGTADTFYLNESAKLLQPVLQGLGADAHFTFRPGRTHFNLYEEHGDRLALMDEITAQMYAVARPKAHWKAPAGEDVLAQSH
jgi:S-formylglutathione hydrolase FrmB